MLHTQGAPLLSAGQVPAVLSTMLVTRHQQYRPLLWSAMGGFVELFPEHLDCPLIVPLLPSPFVIVTLHVASALLESV